MDAFSCTLGGSVSYFLSSTLTDAFTLRPLLSRFLPAIPSAVGHESNRLSPFIVLHKYLVSSSNLIFFANFSGGREAIN